MVERDKNFFNYRKWRTEGLSEEDGVIVASDQAQEWLLPWWWENYHRFNSHPVAFVDYGISDEMRAWCQERGTLIDLFLPDLGSAGNSMLHLLSLDKDMYIDEEFWHSRSAWFKKPLACLQSPYKRSIWMDLDCEVRGSIANLLESHGQFLSLAKDVYSDESASSFPIFNSGVIVFDHGASVIAEWADLAFEQNHLFFGDQDMLSWIIHQKKQVEEMPTIYNWSRKLDENPQAVVVHWHGLEGKKHIQQILLSQSS